MRRAAVLLFAMSVVLAACSSSDPYEPAPQSERARGGGEGLRGAAGGGMLELLPPPNWWRDDRIAGPVNPSTDQVTSLDKLWSDQGDEISRLTRDSEMAVRQLRDALDLDQPKSEDILAAGQRVRALRDDVFDRQLRLLDAERRILTTQQWSTLQNQLVNARSQRQQERRGYPGGYGGRGRGMGGRRPGWDY